MLTPWEFNRKIDERARILKAEAVTPLHAAAGVDAQDDDEAEAERRRERVQHEAVPYAEPAELPEVEHADLGKRYNQAYEPPYGYPIPAAVHPEQFRRGPIVTGEAAYSAGHEPPLTSHLGLAGDSTVVARPLMSDGQLEVPMSAIRGPR
jgi:hypothetical protein